MSRSELWVCWPCSVLHVHIGWLTGFFTGCHLSVPAKRQLPQPEQSPQSICYLSQDTATLVLSFSTATIVAKLKIFRLPPSPSVGGLVEADFDSLIRRAPHQLTRKLRPFQSSSTFLPRRQNASRTRSMTKTPRVTSIQADTRTEMIYCLLLSGRPHWPGAGLVCYRNCFRRPSQPR